MLIWVDIQEEPLPPTTQPLNQFYPPQLQGLTPPHLRRKACEQNRGVQ